MSGTGTKLTPALCSAFLASTPDGITIVDPDGRIIEWNKGCERIFQRPREEVLGRHLADIQYESFPEALRSDERLHGIRMMMNRILTAEIELPVQGIQSFVIVRPDSSRCHIEQQPFIMEIDGQRHLAAVIRDVTDRLDISDSLEWELHLNVAVSKLSNALQDTTLALSDIAFIVHDNAIGLTGSEHGYVGTIEQGTGSLVVHTFTEMINSTCRVDDSAKKIEFPRRPDGTYNSLWGHALNTREPFFTNDVPAHAATSGTPRGHIPLFNFLSVPVIWEGEPVGQIALANKPNGFLHRDLFGIERLANLFALFLDRKAKDDRLRASEERFATFMKNFPGPTFILDENNNVVHLNEWYAREFSWEIEGLEGCSLDSVLSSEMLRSFEAQNRRVLLEKRAQQFEDKVVTRSGPRTFLTTKFPLKLSNDATLIGGFSLDITERAATEQRLRESERDFRELFESAGDALIVFEPDDEHILDVNAQACRVYGLAKHDFVRSKLTEFSLTPEAGRERIDQLLKTGHLDTFETVHHTADGRDIIVSVAARLVDFKGQRAILSINRDITEEKRVRAEHERYSMTLNSLLDRLPLLIIRARHDLTIQSVMGRTENIIGVAQEEVVQDDLVNLFPEKAGELRRHPLQQPLQFRAAYQRDDDTLSLQAYLFPTDEGILAIAMDVSEQVRLEEKLRDSQKLESLGVLAGGIAHDFNNLLMGVLGNATLLQDMLPTDDDLQDILHDIVDSAERASKLSRQML
ncbi:PAS domain S-box protein, partial [bacterium]|nr:PAS domain S-box protein [bacterium]